MAAVTLDRVTKRFGEVVAVRDVSIHVDDGEFLALVGPSGCGKSTTLRMIAGLEDVTAGRIYIGDRLVNDVPPRNRDVAMVFQNYARYPHMDVYHNMAFALKLRKVPKAEIDRRVKETARLLGIDDILHRRPKQLSGGQQQRVALGRAIVREPAVCLMDEPLSNLDAQLRVRMRAELRKLHQRLRTTTIYVTHDQTEAMTMGDRIVVMKDGTVQQVGVPLDVYNNPANVFVAGFIGSPRMNFLPAIVERDGDAWWVRTVAFGLPIHPARRAHFTGLGEYVNREILIGIRPEDVGDGFPGRGVRPEWSFTAPVEVIEPMGAETYVHVDVSGESVVARVHPGSRIRVGDVHRFTVNMENIHLFDKDTREAIR